MILRETKVAISKSTSHEAFQAPVLEALAAWAGNGRNGTLEQERVAFRDGTTPRWFHHRWSQCRGVCLNHLKVSPPVTQTTRHTPWMPSKMLRQPDQ